MKFFMGLSVWTCTIRSPPPRGLSYFYCFNALYVHYARNNYLTPRCLLHTASPTVGPGLLAREPVWLTPSPPCDDTLGLQLALSPALIGPFRKLHEWGLEGSHQVNGFSGASSSPLGQVAGAALLRDHEASWNHLQSNCTVSPHFPKSDSPVKPPHAKQHRAEQPFCWDCAVASEGT